MAPDYLAAIFDGSSLYQIGYCIKYDGIFPSDKSCFLISEAKITYIEMLSGEKGGRAPGDFMKI